MTTFALAPIFSPYLEGLRPDDPAPDDRPLKAVGLASSVDTIPDRPY